MRYWIKFCQIWKIWQLMTGMWAKFVIQILSIFILQQCLQIQISAPVSPERSNTVNDIFRQLRKFGSPKVAFRLPTKSAEIVPKKSPLPIMVDGSTQVCPSRQNIGVTCDILQCFPSRSKIPTKKPTEASSQSTRSSKSASIHSIPSIKVKGSPNISQLKKDSQKIFKGLKQLVKK